LSTDFQIPEFGHLADMVETATPPQGSTAACWLIDVAKAVIEAAPGTASAAIEAVDDLSVFSAESEAWEIACDLRAWTAMFDSDDDPRRTVIDNDFSDAVGDYAIYLLRAIASMLARQLFTAMNSTEE